MKTIREKAAASYELRGERVAVSELKAKCLSYVEATRSKGRRYVITKHGIPVAQLVPLEPRLKSLLGSWKGRIEIVGDIVHNDWSEEFEVLSD